MKFAAASGLVSIVLVLGCRHEQEAGSGPAAARSATDATRIAASVADLHSLEPVDQEVRRAPTDCRAPVPLGPRESAASGSEAHAHKLYHLFARDRAAYLDVAAGASQRQQVLVKQAFVAEPWDRPGSGGGAEDVVRLRDGSYARRGAPTGLFVMVNDGTGRGEESWIYGTVAPDGAVTSSGRIGSCIACHDAAPYDGLFGIE